MKGWNRFYRRMHALDTHKLLALALICIAVDSGTAFMTFQLAPETFANHEQNDLTRWAYTTGHVEGFLVAEGMAIMVPVMFFALSSWTRWIWCRFMLLFAPMMFLYGASTNLIGLVVHPTNMAFTILKFSAVFFIAAVFINRKSLAWMTDGRWSLSTNRMSAKILSRPEG